MIRHLMDPFCHGAGAVSRRRRRRRCAKGGAAPSTFPKPLSAAKGGWEPPFKSLALRGRARTGADGRRSCALWALRHPLFQSKHESGADGQRTAAVGPKLGRPATGGTSGRAGASTEPSPELSGVHQRLGVFTTDSSILPRQCSHAPFQLIHCSLQKRTSPPHRGRSRSS